MINGATLGYRPKVASVSGATHWWLQKGDHIIDPTKSQYDGETPPYDLGRYCGFLTGYEKPSKKARELMKIASLSVGRSLDVADGVHV